MSEAFLLGVGLTPFGVHAARTHKDLAAEAVRAALADAGLSEGRAPIEGAYFGSPSVSLSGLQRILETETWPWLHPKLRR